MEYLNLEVSNSVAGGKSKRVTSLYAGGATKKIEIFYEFDRIIPWSEDTLLDGHVLAVLLYASSQGKDLKVHGTLSRTAMRNIEELLMAWGRWKPDIYKKISILPDRVVDTRKQHAEERAISAFSGGVDAMFTALSHTSLLPEAVRYPLGSVLMVHGFDVDIYNSTAFEQLTKRVRPALDSLSLELRTLRTNSRELKLQDWDYSHGLELAACLHMYSDEFAFGLIGSTDPYEALVLPWGSNPVTDHLMSGGNFSIVHDGAGFSRTEKVAKISAYPFACKALKVCWAGSDQSGNCGKCEKCVRTQLNFLAVGVQGAVPCFPGEFDINNINTIQLNNLVQIGEMVSIAEYAKAHNVSGEWLTVLNARIAKWQPPDPKLLARQKNGGFLKRAGVKLLTDIGLAEPVKKLWRRIKRAMA